jgi:hypothetical protein
MSKETRDKRAYLAYLEKLLGLQKENPEYTLEDGTHIILEIAKVEEHIKDLSFVIKHYAENETG